MIPVRLGRIVIRDNAEQQWIYLNEVDGPRGFAIIIGTNEVHEIQRVISGIQPERPLTHQLAHASIQALGAEVRRIDIIDLKNNTFYAQLVLVDESREMTAVVDARPSDALAIGLRAKCPIRVAESVLEQVRTDSAPDALPEPEDQSDPED